MTDPLHEAGQLPTVAVSRQRFDELLGFEEEWKFLKAELDGLNPCDGCQLVGCQAPVLEKKLAGEALDSIASGIARAIDQWRASHPDVMISEILSGLEEVRHNLTEALIRHGLSFRPRAGNG